MKEVNVINIDDEEYLLIDIVTIDNNNYFILASINNPSDVIYRKRIIEQGERYLVELDAEEHSRLLSEIYAKYSQL